MENLQNERLLAKMVYDKWGDVYIATESYSAIFKNQLYPWVLQLLNTLKSQLFGCHFDGRDVPLTMTISPPASTPFEARRTVRPSYQYNLTVYLEVIGDGKILWNMSLYLPIMLKSSYCKTYGKSAKECYEMGIGTGDSGGYVMNGKGLTIIRPIETSHPAIPKVLKGSAIIDKVRSRSEKHSVDSLNIISNLSRTWSNLYPDKLLLSESYGYSGEVLKSYIKGTPVSKPSARTTTVANTPAGSPKTKITRAKKANIASSNVDMDALVVSGTAGAANAAAISSNHMQNISAANVAATSSDTLSRIGPHLLVPSKKSAPKGPDGKHVEMTPRITETTLTKCSFENIYSLMTNVEIYAIDIVYYVWISLPAVNKKLYVANQSYVPMIPGIYSISGKLIHIMHALFYAQYFNANIEHCSSTFFDIGMPSFKEMIMDAFVTVTSPSKLATMKATIYNSFLNYENMCRSLSAFELFTSFYGNSPSDIAIKTPIELVNHVADYIIPMSDGLGRTRHTNKARALATMFAAQIDATVTQHVSDLHSYKNKSIITAGTTIFRYIRERINLRVWAACTSTSNNAKIRAATKNTCVLSSFKPKGTLGSVTRGETGPHGIMNLVKETLNKQTMQIRTIAVPGTTRVRHGARMVQCDQIGAIDPIYTPESGDVGKRKELALMGLISICRDKALIMQFLQSQFFGRDFGDGRGIVKNRGISINKNDVVGTDVRLLYIEGIPEIYVSREFFITMRDYFRKDGPIDPTVPFPSTHGFVNCFTTLTQLENEQSKVHTFDIVFSLRNDRYTIFHSGGVVGHMLLTATDGQLTLDTSAFRAAYGADPWQYPNMDKFLAMGALVFVTPMDEYFSCSSIAKFYSTPSIRDMPLCDVANNSDHAHTRNVVDIDNDKNLCHWCWHRAVPLTDPWQSLRLDDKGQFSPGKYADTIQCACGYRWHKHCHDILTSRFGVNLDECTKCAKNKDAIIMPPMVRDFREDYEYVFIDPSMMFGTSSSSVPFTNEVYAVRTAYHSNMDLQRPDSQNGLLTNQDVTLKISMNAQVPICGTWFNRMNQQERHGGANLIIANLMLPLDNEDAKYISTTAAREHLRYKSYNTIRIEFPRKDAILNHRGTGYMVSKIHAGMCNSVEHAKFHAIDRKLGIPKIGAYIRPGDAIFAMYVTTTTGEIIDRTTFGDIQYCGYVEQVYLRQFEPSNENNCPISISTYVSIVLSTTYCYATGDKLCFPYSQKGVVSRVLERKDMGRVVGGPFDGCIPDIIDAPTTRSTRMTVGLDNEIATTKVALFDGKQKDATAYRNRYGVPDECGISKTPDFDDNHALLQMYGCPNGVIEKFRLPNGKIVSVSLGCTRVLMLRHHAADKVRCGEYDPNRIGGDIFRQSTRGRTGASRIGYQESQAFFSMGASNMLQSMILMGSQKQNVMQCVNCGLSATLVPSNGLSHTCDKCSGELVGVVLPYSLIVLQHILATAHIDVRTYPSLVTK